MAANLGSARGSIIIDIGDAVSNINRLKGELGGLQTASRQMDEAARGGFTGMAESIKRNEQAINAVGQTMLAAGAVITGAFAIGLNSAANFEQGMNRVKALTGATGDQFTLLKDRALEMSSTTRYTATETADAMSFLAMAGFEVQEIYDALPGTLNLAAAAQMDLGRAADISSNILTAFGMQASELTNVADMLTYTFTNSNTSMEQLGEAFKYVGPVAQAAGLEFSEVAAALGLLGDAGIQSSMAGTTLRGAITRLISPTKKVQGILDDLGITVTDSNGKMLGLAEILAQFPPVTAESAQAMQQFQAQAEAAGIALEDAEGNARPFEEVLRDMEAAGIDTSEMLDQLGADADTVAAIMEVFGLRAGPGMMALLAMGHEEITRFANEINNAGGTAERVANTQLEGLRGSLLMLRSAWEVLMIRMMDAGPIQIVTSAVKALTLGVQQLLKLPAPILGLIGILTGLTGAVLTLGGAFLLLLPRIAKTYLAFQDFKRWGGMARVFREVSVAIHGLRAAFMSLTFANPLFLALTAAVIAFAAAWKFNWFGLRDSVTSAVDSIRNALNRLREGFEYFRSLGQNPVSAALNAVSAALRSFDIGLLDTIADKLTGIAYGIQAFFDGFRRQDTHIESTFEVKFEGDQHYIDWQEQPDGSIKYAIMHVDEDGSLTEFGEIIESYDDPDDPNIAHIKIRGEDGEFWTTAEKDTGHIGDATIEVKTDQKALKDTRKNIDRIRDGLRNMQKQLRRQNLDPLADMVDYVIAGVDAWESLTNQYNQFRQIMDPVSAGLMSLGATFPQLNRVILPVVSAWQAMRERLAELQSYFQAFRSLGINPVSSALLALGATFDVLMPVMSRLADMVGNLGDAFAALRAGNWGQFFVEIQSAANNLWGAIREGLSLVRELAVAVADWVINVGIPRVVGFARDIWTAVRDWVVNTAWPAVRDAAIEIAGVVLDIIEWVRGNAPQIREFVETWVRALVAAAGRLVGRIAEAALDILEWVRGKAPQIREFVDTWVRALVAAAGRVIGEIAEATVDILKWVRGNAPQIREFVESWVQSLVAVAGKIIGTIDQVTVNITEFVEGAVDDIVSRIEEWLGTPLVPITADGDVSWGEIGVPAEGTTAEKIRNAIGSVTVDGIVATLNFLSQLGEIEGVAEAITDAKNNLMNRALQVSGIGLGVSFLASMGPLGVLGLAGVMLVAYNNVVDYFADNPMDLIDLAVAVKGVFDSAASEFLISHAEITAAILDALGVVPGAPILLDIPTAIKALWDGEIELDFSAEDIAKAAINAIVPGGSLLLEIPVDINLPWQDDGESDDGEGGGAAGSTWVGDWNSKLMRELEFMRAAADQGMRNITSTMSTNAREWNATMLSGIGALAQTTHGGATGSVTPSLEAVRSATDSGMERVRSTVDTKGNEWGTAMGNALRSLQSGAAGGGAAAGGALAGLAGGGFLADLNTQVSDGMEQVRMTVDTRGREWGTTLQTATSELPQIARTAFGQLSDAATQPLMTLGQTVATQTATMASTAATNFGSILGSANATFPQIRSTGTSNISTLSSSVTSSVGSMVGTVASRLSSMASGAASTFRNLRSTGTSEANTTRTNVTSAITSMASTSATEVAGMQAGIAMSMLVMKSSATSAASDTRSQVVAAFTQMALQAAQIVRTGMSQIPGIITAAGAAAAGAARAAGSMIGAGLAAGMMSALGAVRAAANALVAEASRAIAARAMISSPAKAFMPHGRYITEGLAVGLTSTRAMDVLRNAAGTVVGSLDDLLYARPGFGLGFGPRAALGGVVINNEWNITQLPGEDSEVFAQRVARIVSDEIERDFDSVFGGAY